MQKCRRGGTGRRPGLKIPWVAIPVPVRFRSPAFIERALDKSVIIDEKKLIEYVCVAQLDRALGYGPRCREFESSRARMLNSLRFLKNQGFRAIFVYADFMNPF